MSFGDSDVRTEQCVAAILWLYSLRYFSVWNFGKRGRWRDFTCRHSLDGCIEVWRAGVLVEIDVHTACRIVANLYLYKGYDRASQPNA